MQTSRTEVLCQIKFWSTFARYKKGEKSTKINSQCKWSNSAQPQSNGVAIYEEILSSEFILPIFRLFIRSSNYRSRISKVNKENDSDRERQKNLSKGDGNIIGKIHTSHKSNLYHTSYLRMTKTAVYFRQIFLCNRSVS